MSKENNQLALFEMKEWWGDEWEGMPEFVQNDITSWKSIIIHLKDRNDMEAFGRLINQRIGKKTKSLWYPELTPAQLIKIRYVDSEDES